MEPQASQDLNIYSEGIWMVLEDHRVFFFLRSNPTKKNVGFIGVQVRLNEHSKMVLVYMRNQTELCGMLELLLEVVCLRWEETAL